MIKTEVITEILWPTGPDIGGQVPARAPPPAPAPASALVSTGLATAAGLPQSLALHAQASSQRVAPQPHEKDELTGLYRCRYDVHQPAASYSCIVCRTEPCSTLTSTCGTASHHHTLSRPLPSRSLPPLCCRYPNCTRQFKTGYQLHSHTGWHKRKENLDAGVYDRCSHPLKVRLR
eukprot:COSAG06_NODE_8968_length_2022_cov_2.432137_2_plen_176_part_00